MHDDRVEFEEASIASARDIGADEMLQTQAQQLFAAADKHDYSYVWKWLGMPIIQVPADIVATQEIIWETRPTLIVETGVARGGSLIFYSSILQLLGEGEVLGIDIDVRQHNREAIESHPLGHRVRLIQGSSVEPHVVEQVARRAASAARVLVVLDSNHTHDHVLAEMRAYADLVTAGSYLIVADTIVDKIPGHLHRNRPWGPANNPATAVRAFLRERDDFVADLEVNGKLLLTSSPGGYLKRLRG